MNPVLSDEKTVRPRWFVPLGGRRRAGAPAEPAERAGSGGAGIAWWILPALLFFLPILFLEAPGSNASSLLEQMRASYAEVEDYRADIVIRRRGEDGSEKVERLTYTFKKPDRIRVDFHSPHEGLVLVHPNQEGKAVVRPFPWAPFLKMHLDPEFSLAVGSAGQRIDQTDLGFLIEGIGRSLTARSRGAPVIEESDDALTIRVLAEDLFRRDRITRYGFRIDKTRWLPVAVEEHTPEGELRRKVRIRKLRTNLGISDGIFSLED